MPNAGAIQRNAMTANELGKGQAMPEATPQQVDTNATSGATTEKTFTQAEMDAIIGERLGRMKAKYADYDELQAKAAKYDEAEEASKSELQKAVERAEKAEAELGKLKAEAERAEQIAKIAAEKGVDAALLARMSGDIAENADFLKAQKDNAPKYGSVADGGEATPPTSKKSTAQMFADTLDGIL